MNTYRFNINSIRDPPNNGVLNHDIQGTNPDIVNKRCKISWQSLSLETSSRISNALGMVADGTGNAATALVVKTKSALLLGPVGTTGFLSVAGAGNTSVAFTTNSATSITLGTAQTWADEAVVTIDSVTNGSNVQMSDYPHLALHSNVPDNSGNTELLKIDFNQVKTFSNDFEIMTTSNDSTYSYESTVPSRLELHFTSNLEGTIKLDTTNPLSIQLILQTLE